MEIVTAVVDAPWGPIRLAATDRGLASLDQLVEHGQFLERLERRFGARAVDIGSAAASRPATAHALHARAAVEAFLDGDLGSVTELVVDIDDRPAWDQLVLLAVRTIPPGTTMSYGGVARMIGKAGAARAVGGAVGRNPVGLVIPCHRVIAGDGTLGGYGGGWWGGRQAGLELKRELLVREGVRIPASAAR